MSHLALHTREDATTEICGLCGQVIELPAGHQLRTIDNLDPVCADCAGKHAPSLAALVNLARTAERISRIGRNSVFPPLTALLDLASAAEMYTCTVAPPQRKAG